MAKLILNLINRYIYLIVFILFTINISGQNDNEKALILFESKNYSEALPLFKESFEKFPENKNLSYFLGVCLVETENYGTEVTRLLLNASKGDVPFNVNFYLAKNYHALNKFELASAFYQMFRNNGKPKEIKETKVKDLISMASKRINPFEKRNSLDNKSSQQENNIQDSINSENSQNAKPILNSDYIPDSNTTSSVPVDDKNTIPFNPTPNIDSVSFLIPDALKDSIINFNIASDISYMNAKQFKTKTGVINFFEGWKYSIELSEKIKMTDDLRKNYENAKSYEEKSEISTKVLNLEKEIYELKNATDLKFNKAREAESNYWLDKDFSDIIKLKNENDSIINLEIDRIRNAAKSEIEELETMENSTFGETINKDSTITTHHSLNKEEKKPTNEIKYKIQIGAFKTELPPASKALFKKLSVLRKIDSYTDEKGVTFYTIGEVDNFKDAVKLQDQIRKESIKDAFIIIFKDGKKLSFIEAKQFLK